MRILKPLPGTLPRPIHNIVGDWPMNSLGKKIFDLSGNDFTGTEQQDSIWQAGENGPARYFSGNDYINCGDPGNFFTSEITVIVKWKVDDLTAGRIATWGKYNEINSAFAFRKDASSTVRYSVKQNTISVVGHNTGEWITSAISYKQNVWGIVYRNGLFLSNLTGNADAIPTGTYNLLIGCESGPTAYFKGNIEYFYLCNRALIASEIARLYREPFYRYPENRIFPFAT